MPQVGNSKDFGGVFSSTLTASRSFVAAIAAGEAYLAETARANWLKEQDDDDFGGFAVTLQPAFPLVHSSQAALTFLLRGVEMGSC